MKCQQSLCQRTKNLKQSGNCNVCEAAITASNEALENQKRHVVNKTVETDLKLMISTHEKLVKGEAIDKDVVSILLLGGVINILGQHDTILEIENKVKSLEVENLTNKSRIESLENWIMKQNESIKDLDEKLQKLDRNGVVIKENLEMTNLKKKVTGIELDVSGLKITRQERLIKPDSSDSSYKKDAQNTASSIKKCKLCDETFTKNSDFENHMVDKHDVEKKFECEICGKKFLLQWRMKKHGFIHKEEAKTCKYFFDNQHCPFDEVGCKFSHKNEAANEEIVEADYNVKENQCHICKEQLTNSDELWEHVEISHEEYFQGMLEVTKANRS